MIPSHSQSDRRQLAAQRSRRGGFLIPAIAIALLIAMACIALSVDSFWLGSTRVEALSGAEAAALAAGRELVTDDRLLEASDPAWSIERAREAAAKIAAQNVVAGQPLKLNTAQGGDIHFGELVIDPETGLTRFAETSEFPTSVLVTAKRSRQAGNPVGTLVSGRAADVASRVEVTITNAIVGVRPGESSPVPAIPLAILDGDALRTDTWQVQIEARQGADEFGFNRDGDEVYSGGDGIPEIRLRSVAEDDETFEANVRLLNLGGGFKPASLAKQFKNGWGTADLARYGGELLLQKESVPIESTAEILQDEAALFEGIIGQQRICVLYAPTISDDSIVATRLVAVRVMHVETTGDGAYEIVVQPTVISTRTAVLVTEYAQEKQQQEQEENQLDLAGGISNGQLLNHQALGYQDPNSNAANDTLETPVVSPNPYIFKVYVSN